MAWLGSPTAPTTHSLLGWTPDVWTAVASWVTVGVYVAVASIAAWQLKESRLLRREQTRPFVTVAASMRSVLVSLSVCNIGSTQARNVRVTLDHPLESATAMDRSLPWQHRGIFGPGMAALSPGEELRFVLDVFHKRAEADLPMQISGTVSYQDGRTRKAGSYRETLVVDLTAYGDALLNDKNLHDLVEQLEQLRKDVSTQLRSGLDVRASNADRAARRNGAELRRWRFSVERKSKGFRAALAVYLRSIARAALRQP